MAFDIETLDQKVLPASIKYAGQTVGFEYSAGERARNFERALNEIGALTSEQQAETGDGGRKMLIGALCEVLAYWEVNAGGKQVPLDPEMMDALSVPTAFYNAIAQRIGEELNNGGGQGKPR